MSKPIIYTNETCAYCKSVKEELTKKNVEFEERLTSEFTDEYQAIVNMTGIPTVPTVKHDDELYVSGRDFQNIEQLTNENLDEWQEITNLTGIPQVPTMVFKNNYFAPGGDFGNQQHLVSIIKEFKESNISYDRLAFERVKTLNYNINVAFGRLDQLLRQIENKLNIKEDEHKSTN